MSITTRPRFRRRECLSRLPGAPRPDEPCTSGAAWLSRFACKPSYARRLCQFCSNDRLHPGLVDPTLGISETVFLLAFHWDGPEDFGGPIAVAAQRAV
jgi:hypothetical protein